MPTYKIEIYIIIFIDSKYFHAFFHPLMWTQRPKKFSSAIGAYGCQLGFVLVLWLPNFSNLLLFCVDTMWKNNYYLFIWYTTCTLLIPFLALSVFALCYDNLYYSCNYLFIMPRVFPAFYMYFIDPVLQCTCRPCLFVVFGCLGAKL